MTTSTRGRLTAAAALVLAGALAAAPATAAPRDTTAADNPFAGATRVGPQSGPQATALAPADTCPGGTERGRTTLFEGFEDGLPDGGEFTDGFSIGTDTPASGSAYAFSVAPPADELHYMYLEAATVRPGARTFLSFQVRGESGDENMGVVVNEEVWSLVRLEPDTWNPITIDITGVTGYYDDGYIDVQFGHVRNAAIDDTRLEVDEVSLYGCTPTASGLRGDWTGGDPGTVDLLSVGRDGVLSVFPGRGDGTVGNGRQAGTGWGSFTWLGSPGDLDDDGRTDLMARSADGSLYRYSGRGDGALAGGVKVGTGWGGITALTTGGDVAGGSERDVLGRTPNGNLYRYAISSTGGLNAGVQVGAGWNGIRTFVVVDDVNADGKDDVLAINGAGDLYLFRGSPNGLVNGRKVGSGWGGVQLVTSPGDLDGDGRSDVVGRNAAGDLYVFKGSSTGGLIAGTKIGSGWGGSLRLV